ncbi:MAG: cell division topological specificity factor MinE [Thermostichales cyanobacterium SZTDM-1c_bins_54]
MQLLAQLLEMMEHLLARPQSSSRNQARQRLKLILAHDRADLTPAMMEAMRQEILEVVSRYVELDPTGLQFELTAVQGNTALIANLPIRRVKPMPEHLPGEVGPREVGEEKPAEC